MSALAELFEIFFLCLDSCQIFAEPFRHWLLREVFTEDVCRAIVALPFAAAPIGDTEGRRETHNSVRTFFSIENRERFPVCRDLAEVLQSGTTVRKVEETFDIDLAGSFLRIEYCQDRDGFWLEPHTDIAAKLLTVQVYVSAEPGARDWGTDLYDRHGGLAVTVPYEFNCGFGFVPGKDTWHGFRRRPIDGVRRSVIINYVRPEWRARHELAYPDQPAG